MNESFEISNKLGARSLAGSYDFRVFVSFGGNALIETIDPMGAMGSTTITVSERLRDELVRLAAELQMKVGRKVDYEDVIRYLIGRHRKNTKLFEQACSMVAGRAGNVRKELRRGRVEDSRRERELERRYS